MRLNRVLQVALLINLASPFAFSQDVHLVVGGGLLGRIGGFCERSSVTVQNADSVCPKATVPFGGALGLSEKLRSTQQPNRWVVLAGNNFPSDFTIARGTTSRRTTFWNIVRDIQPDVMALGQDDFLRALLPASLENSGTPEEGFREPLAEFFRTGTDDFRFLVSNAYIRTHKKGINVTRHNSYELIDVNPDQTIPWTTSKLSISLPNNAPANLDVELTGAALESKEQKGNKLTIKLSVTATLDPNAEITVEVVSKAQFKLRFDRPLTPWKNPETDALRSLPVAHLKGRGAPLLVAAVVDPAIRAVLDVSRWSYETGDIKEEVVLLPPADTLKAILHRARGMDALPVLLSDLTDGTALQTVFSNQSWKVVSLNPDTHMLGCADGAKGCGKGRQRDAEGGSTAVINSGRPTAQVWIRPEWFGETLIDITGETDGSGGWKSQSVKYSEVDGFTPTITAIKSGGSMQMTAPVLNLNRDLGYLLPPKYYNAATAGEAVWWKSRDSIARVLMDSVRKNAQAELAITDSRFIDSDVIAELAEEADEGLRDGIRPADLMAILWRYDGYVRTFLKGSELVELLGKLAQVQADDFGAGYCIRGLSSGSEDVGCSIPQKPSLTALRVNGRYFDSSMVYSVAMPQALATTLQQGSNRVTNVFTAMHRYVWEDKEFQDGPQGDPLVITQLASTSITSLPAAAVPAATPKINLANRFERKWLSLFYMPPATIDLGGQNFKVPDGPDGKPDTSGFSAIPIVGEKVTHTFKFNFVGELHFIPLDVRAFTLDILTSVNLNRLDTYPVTADGLKQTSYTPDLWRNGAVLRSRIVTDLVTKSFEKVARRLSRHYAADSFRIEPFVGYFDDTSIFHFENVFESKKQKDAAGNAIRLSEHDPKPEYRYVGFGVGFTDIPLTRFFKLKATSFRHDTGQNHTKPYGVVVGGSTYDMEQVRRCGIQNLIDGSSACTAAVLIDQPREVRYLYRKTKEARDQYATSLEFTHGAASKKITVTLDFKGYRWSTPTTPLEPVWSADTTLKTSIPLFAGISVGPYFRYYQVKALGASRTYVSNKFGLALTLPVFAKVGHGAFIY